MVVVFISSVEIAVVVADKLLELERKDSVLVTSHTARAGRAKLAFLQRSLLHFEKHEFFVCVHETMAVTRDEIYTYNLPIDTPCTPQQS